MKRCILICAITITLLAASPPRAGLDTLEVSSAERARLEDRLLRELSPRVRVFDSVVFTLDGEGTVTLTGSVLDAATKDSVEQIVRSVSGVTAVRNLIEVLPQSATDDALRLTVFYAIYDRPGMARYAVPGEMPIHIVVRNGAVVLEGAVASRFDLIQTNAAVTRVSGVLAFENNLTVGGNYEIHHVTFSDAAR